jgi:hypothetical protein
MDPMKQIFGCALSLCLLTLSLHAAVEGNYTFSGWDPYANLSYKGTSTITQDKGDVYQAVWNFEDGEKYKGTGIKTGDQISFMFTRLTGPNGEDPFGVQVYKIQENTLLGSWVLLEKSLVGNEKMEKQP